MQLKTEQRPIASAGLQKAVCVDIVEHGLVETKFGMKDVIDIVWEVDEMDPKYDQRLTVQKRYNVSMNEKSNLRQDLESWIGRGFKPEELKRGIDTEKLIGRGAMLNIVHNESGDRTYANVKAIMPLPKGEQVDPYGSYTRVMDRENSWDVRAKQRQAAGSAAAGGAMDGEDFGLPEPDADLPF